MKTGTVLKSTTVLTSRVGARDSVDTYLAELAAGPQLDRLQELEAAERILAAEHAALRVIVEAGIPLPELCDEVRCGAEPSTGSASKSSASKGSAMAKTTTTGDASSAKASAPRTGTVEVHDGKAVSRSKVEVRNGKVEVRNRNKVATRTSGLREREAPGEQPSSGKPSSEKEQALRREARRRARLRRLEEKYVALRRELSDRSLRGTRRAESKAELAENRKKRNALVQPESIDRATSEAVRNRVSSAIKELRAIDDASQRARKQAGDLPAPAIRCALKAQRPPRGRNLERLKESEAILRECATRLDALEEKLGMPRERLRVVGRRLAVHERELAEAKRILTTSNLRLVVYFARRLRRTGLAFADLVQEGNLGLMRAVDKYDPRVGTRFSTYASWWIRQAMQRAAIDQGRSIRIPVHMSDTIYRTRRCSQQLAQRLGRDPTHEEVAKELHTTPEDVRFALETGRQMVESLDQPIGPESDRRVGDLVADDTTPDLDATVDDDERFDRVRRMLSRLTPREQEIVAKRFGLADERDHTLQEIGEHFQLSRERIRQIEAEAIAKLRAHCTRADLAELERRRDSGS